MSRSMGGPCRLKFCYCSDIHHFIPHMHGISGMSLSKDYETETNRLLSELHILLH